MTDRRWRGTGRSLWAGAFLLLVGLVFPQAALAMISVERIVESLRPVQEVALDLEPVAAVYSKDGKSIFVAGRPSNADGGVVVEYDRLQLTPRREFRLPHSIEALELAPAGDRLVAAGNFSDPSVGGLSSIRLADGAVATARLQVPLELPSVSIGRTGKIYLSNLQSNIISGIAAESFDVPLPEGSRFLPFEALTVEPYFFDSKLRIRQIIVSEEDKVIFIVPDEETKIYAMELTGFGQLLDDAGYSVEGRGSSLPLAAFASRVPAADHPEGRMSFLLADHQMQTIMLQEYDPKFRTINLITIARVGHELLPGTTIDTVPGTGSVRQPMLISSDAKLSKILSANIYSRELVIFTHEQGEQFLEQVAKLELDQAPSALAVNPSGEDAIVLFKNERKMLLLADPAKSPVKSVPKDVPVELTGEDWVRDLQKVLTQKGFPVGSIDGILGARTRYSLDLATKEFQLNADPSDLNGVIKELKAAVPRMEKF